jgi:2-methylisocitrate lyase-like PEP mutase family enzyme
MDEREALRRGAVFRDLHARGIVVLANPWDAGSARMFEHLGFRALATTSAGHAFTLGRRDGDGAVSRDEALAHARQLLDATTVPITADLENGYGRTPEVVAETIRLAGALGLAGASIEDATLDAAPHDEPLYDRGLAVERVRAAVEAARALPYPFVLTARAENFVRGRPDVDDALGRLAAYAEAGADVICAPFLPDEAAIRRACALGPPVHYIAGRTRFTVAQLAGMGVRRVTVGASLARAAFAAAMRAARDVLERGVFDAFDGLPSVAELNELIDPRGQSVYQGAEYTVVPSVK